MEDSGASHEDLGTRFYNHRCCVRIDASIYLQLAACLLLLKQPLHLANLRERGLNEMLAAETRIYRHN